MAISTDDILRLGVVIARAGLTDIFANIFHAKVVDDNGQSQANLKIDIAKLMDNIFQAVDTYVSDNYSFDHIDVFNITQNTDEGVLTFPLLTGGSEVGENVAEGVAGLCYFHTAKPRRIGRKFLAGFTETHLADGIWNASLVGGLANFVDSIVNPLALPNLSVYELGTWGWIDAEQQGLGKEFNGFTDGLTSDVPAYQRRRKRGVGS